MFIRTVDEALERMLRAGLAMPEDVGDVTFQAPTSSWSAQLSRLTVNLFLYDLNRSSQPARAATQRIGENGRAERRAPQPMIQLSYLVSAWAGGPRDEHQLLGDMVSRLAAVSVIPPEFVTGPLSSSINIALVEDPRNRLRDIWSGVGGHLKASFTLQVTVAADTFDWRAEAPQVTEISTLLAPLPRVPSA